MNDVVYITMANAAAIVNRIDPKRLDRINGTIYKRAVYVFSKRDKARLLAIQELFRNPEHFISDFYEKIDRTDHGELVFEGSAPAHHLKPDCERLHSDFSNYEVPGFVREKGFKAIKEFRNWFKIHMYLLNERPEYFQLRFKTHYGIWIEPKLVERPNSGMTKFDNLDLATLENRIDGILNRAAELYNSNARNQRIISNWGKHAWLGRRADKPLMNNNMDIDEGTIRDFLREYEDTIISPLKRYLIEYYKVKLNPHLEFTKRLLAELGFEPCHACHRGTSLRMDQESLCAVA